MCLQAHPDEVADTAAEEGIAHGSIPADGRASLKMKAELSLSETKADYKKTNPERVRKVSEKTEQQASLVM